MNVDRIPFVANEVVIIILLEFIFVNKETSCERCACCERMTIAVDYAIDNYHSFTTTL